MENVAHKRSSGTRRFTEAMSIAEHLADSYRRADTVSPTLLLNGLKRAAPYMRLPRSVIALLDELVAHSKPQDWQYDAVPIVWPRNETLALRMAVGVRQLQNIVRATIELGLIIPIDSANGHRGGLRDKTGKIIWAYGFDLRPIGARQQEFLAIAARGNADDKEIDRLRRAITASRRRARMLVETHDPAEPLPAHIAVAKRNIDAAVLAAKCSRDIPGLINAVARIRVDLAAIESASKADFSLTPHRSDAVDALLEIAPKTATHFIHQTTTNQLRTSSAVTCRGSAGESSACGDGGASSETAVEQDLRRHGIDAAFIAKACPELTSDLVDSPRAWGRLVSISETLVHQHHIPIQAWREACRIMGQHGAAAAVIATIYKHWRGDVDSPGAYLRGLTKRSISGELNLAKTYHGLRETAQPMHGDRAAIGSVRLRSGTMRIGAGAYNRA